MPRHIFELCWSLRSSDGKVTLDKIAFRPAATCEQKRDAKTGADLGFRQRVWQFGGITNASFQGQKIPGYVDIPPARSWVHIHGAHRKPLTGASEMQISYWAYETKLKLLFLWFQYLEAQSLPKLVVYGNDQREASAKADDIASMRSSGVVGFARPPQGQALFEIIESSGRGADQFQHALDFLEQWQTNSVLAGFLDLVRRASGGVGSYALSSDQSNFFLKSRQAVAAEMAESFTHGVLSPLTVLNSGPDAACPSLECGPLEEKGNEDLMRVFQAMAAAPSLNVPAGFLDLITEKLAAVLGLDASEVSKIVAENAQQRQAQATQAAEGSPPQVQEAAGQIGRLHGAVTAATGIARQVTQPGAAEQLGAPSRGRHSAR